MNKTSYIICAEGGCSGHFIACLIRSMWDDKFFENNYIPSNGSCDNISNAGCLHADYALADKKIDVYPERPEAAEIILDAIKNPESTYVKFFNSYIKEYDHLNVLHYWNKTNIENFLSVPNVKVILVRAHEKDYKQIAVNKISKNFTNEIDYTKIDINIVKSSLRRLLTWAELTDNLAELETMKTMQDVSFKIKLDLVQAWEKYISIRSIKNELPESNPKLLVLYFDDILNNKETVMNELAAFVNSTVDNSTKNMYNDYLAKQPSIESFLNNA
jgi:hypothetical protein